MKCIYKIENTTNGKFYIGSSLNYQKRKARHITSLRKGSHHNIHLQRAWNKYGENSFTFEILEECDECRVREQEILDSLDWLNCYNISATSSGGDMIKNHPDRDEIVRKVIERLKSVKKPEPKFGKDNGNWRGGKTFCKCGARIQSNNKSCMKCSDRKGENNAFYGKSHSQEVKDKLSEQRKGIYKGNQEKAVVLEGITYKSVSEAARQLGVVPATILYRLKKQAIKAELSTGLKK